MTIRICLLSLIGLPATGKTTFSKWLLELPQTPLNIIHICYDDYLPQPINRNSRDTEFEFKNERIKILSLISELINALKNTSRLPKDFNTSVKLSLHTGSQDFLIISDDNNYYRSMRYKFYQLGRQNCCAYAQVYFACGVGYALERNGDRPFVERVSEETIRRMAGRLETPDPTTQRWESNTFILNECENYNAIRIELLAFLSKTFENTLHPIPVKQKAETMQPITHQLDLLLRKRIGEILKIENIAENRKLMATALNIKRKEILQKVKIKSDEELSFDDLNGYVNMLH